MGYDMCSQNMFVLHEGRQETWGKPHLCMPMVVPAVVRPPKLSLTPAPLLCILPLQADPENCVYPPSCLVDANGFDQRKHFTSHWTPVVPHSYTSLVEQSQVALGVNIQ